MTPLPKIDPANVLPSFPQLKRHISDLSVETSKFVVQYRQSLNTLTDKGLVDAVAWYGRLQHAASGIVHASEFVEAKYGSQGAIVAEDMKVSAMSSMSDVLFFAQFLMQLPASKLETLSQDPALLRCAPLLRFMSRPEIRQQAPLPEPEQRKLVRNLETHFGNKHLDEGVREQLMVFAEAMLKAAKGGFVDPQLAAQDKDFLKSSEVSALRRALAANKEALRLYVYHRKLDFFHDHATSSQMIDKPDLLDWKAASDIAIKAHTLLSPELGKEAASIFERGLIEASPVVPGLNYTIMASGIYPPMIFIGFRGSLFQSQEVDHEVGHAVHCLRRNRSGELKPFDSAAINEVFPDLQERMFWKQISLSYPGQIDASTLALDNFAGYVSRFSMIDQFQQSAAKLLNQSVKFKARDLDARWAGLQEDYFGAENFVRPKSWRNMVFMSERPFSSISYVYAQLVAERMWQEHQKDPSGFAPTLHTFLNDGNAKPPAELLKPMGFDTSDPHFWSEAFRDLRQAASTMSGKSFPTPKL